MRRSTSTRPPTRNSRPTSPTASEVGSTIEVAEKLIPTDHGFALQRLPLETNYFEAYNRDNVELVSLQDTPIVRVTADGIETTAGHHDLDVIVYATGFGAITGAFDRIDIRGRRGDAR